MNTFSNILFIAGSDVVDNNALSHAVSTEVGSVLS